MAVASPGFRKQRPDSIYGEASSKTIAIVLAEHAPDLNTPSWYSGSTYDVLTIEDLNIIQAVPYFGSASGSSDIITQRLQVSDPAAAKQAIAATVGATALPKLSELSGARVLVEFLDNGSPFIRTAVCFPEISLSKIPNARSTANLSADVVPDVIDALSESLSNVALRDVNNNNVDSSITWRSRVKYLGEKNERIPVPPQDANTEQKKNAWESAYEIAWIAGFHNAYWSGDIVATDDGQIFTEFENSWIASSTVEESTVRVMKDGWQKGWRQGDIDGQNEARELPPVPTDVDNSTAIKTDVDTESEPGDLEVVDWEQDKALGRDAVFYMEKKGVRVAINHDGSFTLDSRSSGQLIRIQGGDSGMKLTANGAVIEVGADNDAVVAIRAANINVMATESLQLAGNVCRAVLGDAMMGKFNIHTHDETGVETSVPKQQMTSDEVLSDIVVLA